MKKILGVLLAGAVALTCFTACNSSTQENSPTTTDGASEAASQEENSETEAARFRCRCGRSVRCAGRSPHRAGRGRRQGR